MNERKDMEKQTISTIVENRQIRRRRRRRRRRRQRAGISIGSREFGTRWGPGMSGPRDPSPARHWWQDGQNFTSRCKDLRSIISLDLFLRGSSNELLSLNLQNMWRHHLIHCNIPLYEAKCKSMNSSKKLCFSRSWEQRRLPQNFQTKSRWNRENAKRKKQGRIHG